MAIDSPTHTVPASGDDPVEALLISVLDAAETDGVSALEAACEQSPQHASGLRRRWKELERMGLLGDQAIPEVPERLGDFRIVRRLGGGGMGVVYLAVQEPLGREVALKLVRPDQLFLPGLRERFLREVQIVARLQHPGIVPIYTFGKAGGVPYFAMERVHGATFEEVLKSLEGRRLEALDGKALGSALLEVMRAQGETPEPLDEWLYSGTWEQACLRIARLVADALAHVHARGALHRDIKPSNVMLTPGGRVMLLDFGLAHGAGTDRLTRTATQLGSVPYLAPEMLQGGRDAATPQADIYSLGVALYQSLCLRLPYDAPTATATMLAISQGVPIAPRKHNARISEDAQTVCLTAMDADPARRYATADAFARDLANVLEHRPIDARPAGPVRRLARWAERSPARAVAAALGALILLGGPLAWAWKEHTSNVALGAESSRAKRNLASALGAVERLFTRVAQAELSRLPHMEEFRRTLLEDALAFQRGLLSDNAQDETVRLERARTHARIARLLGDLGRSDEAFDSLREGLELLGAAPATAAAAPTGERGLDELRVLAQLRYDEAELALLRSELDASIAAARAAIALAGELVEREQEPAAARLLEVDARRVLASAATRQGGLDEAATAFEDALQKLERAAADGALAQACALAAARLGNEYGTLLIGQARPAEAQLEKAEAVLRETIERFASQPVDDVPERTYALVTLHSTLAYVCTERGRPAEAVELLDGNEAQLATLVERFPSNISYRESLAKLYSNRANYKFMSGRRPEVRSEMEKAVAALSELTRRVPGAADLLSTLAVVENGLGGLDLAEQDFAAARARLESAVEHGTAALAAAPDDALLRERLSQHWFWLYDARRDLGDVDAAIEAMRGYAKYGPESWRTPFEVARRMSELAATLPIESADRAERVESLGVIAADFLRQARDAGCDQWPDVITHEKLADLQQTDALRELSADPAQ